MFEHLFEHLFEPELAFLDTQLLASPIRPQGGIGAVLPAVPILERSFVLEHAFVLNKLNLFCVCIGLSLGDTITCLNVFFQRVANGLLSDCAGCRLAPR